jgi:polar amino acid transport system substrate-binding protein
VIRRRALPALLAASPALAQTREELPNMTPEVKAQLAPTGVLRAGINLSNFLLVTGKAANGDPTGVSPSMAATVAERLGVPVQYVTYPRPSELADAAGTGAWDIGLIGAEPQRAEKIAFTAAYCEIEGSYLVPAGSPITDMAQVDRPGVRIITNAGAAYTLWLERNIKQATLITVPGGGAAAWDRFIADKADVYAGLRPGLIKDIQALPGARILEGKYMAVQQAIGTERKNAAAATWLAAFVEEAKRSGLVAKFIAEHKVQGLSVAPPA